MSFILKRQFKLETNKFKNYLQIVTINVGLGLKEFTFMLCLNVVTFGIDEL